MSWEPGLDLPPGEALAPPPCCPRGRALPAGCLQEALSSAHPRSSSFWVSAVKQLSRKVYE